MKDPHFLISKAIDVIAVVAFACLAAFVAFGLIAD